MKRSFLGILLAVFVLAASSTCAADKTDNKLQQCYLRQFLKSDEIRTTGEIEQWCKMHLENQKLLESEALSPLEKRIIRESDSLDNPNIITSHKRNYFMPATYVRKMNSEPYEGTPYAGKLDNLEAKFQLSLKAPVFRSLLTEKDAVYFGFTLQSYWQMYNSEISSPFRETNYQPEIFYGYLNDLKVGEWTNRVNIIGIEHQSNGRIQPMSRSWNRIYAHFVWENDRWVIGFRPWYRIPEDKKDDPGQPDGDDNPDIYKYMGYYEFTTDYKWDSQSFSLMLRNNLTSNGQGAVQLEWTFSLGSRFRGYAQYFHGYGESLIDYNHSIERFGIGILLTDFF